jgi:SAM-dependent methyltransferase
MEPAAIWHEVECGAYAVDLRFWEDLVPQGDTVLDLGAGTGRVATYLARRGRAVTAVDVDPKVLEVLEERNEERELGIECVCEDVRELSLRRQFDAVLAPMQLLQLMRGPLERRALLTRARRHLRPGGLFAAALMSLDGEPIGSEYISPPPDMREIDGWLYSSQSIALLPIEEGKAIAIDRMRTAVAPDGGRKTHLSRIRLELVEPDELEREMRAAGLLVQDRRSIPATDDHVGSVLVVGTAPEED